MTTILDENLYDHADRLDGSVVLVTGGANGIGRATALDFAKRGAKLVIGDLDEGGARRTADEINSRGGTAISQRCNVLNWDDQVMLFELAIASYSKVDVVIPCAGINETGDFGQMKLDAKNRPVKPNLKTTEINLLAVMFSTHLALHYLTLDVLVASKGINLIIPVESEAYASKQLLAKTMKSIVFIGSIGETLLQQVPETGNRAKSMVYAASIQGIPGDPNYSASKHGVLGFMGGIALGCLEKGIRIGTVCPWFVDTALVDTVVKIAVVGIPKVPLARVSGAIFRCATDPDPKTNASLWTMPDGGPVFRVSRDQLSEGVFRLLNERLLAMARQIGRLESFLNTSIDLWNIAGKSSLLLGIGVLGLFIARHNIGDWMRNAFGLLRSQV